MQTPVLSGYRWKTKDLERLPEEPLRNYSTELTQAPPLPKHGGAVPIKSGGLRGAALPQRPPPPPT
jgi:hypothetical protein